MTWPRAASWLLVAASLVLAGCSDDEPAHEGGSAANSSTVIATDLAPSQIAAATVPEPTKPPPCDPADLDLWTAQVVVADTTADAVIRIRNNGSDWCKADIGRSRFVDPLVEPDVWLDSGATADLVVGQADTGCDDPMPVSVIPVAVGDSEVAVPSALLACEWWLTAFHPNEPAVERCDRGQLDVVVVDAAVLVRNSSTRPCLLDRVTDVIDAGTGAADGADPDADTGAVDGDVDGDVVDVRQVLPGDVVAFGRRLRTPCGGPPRPVVLVGNAVGELDAVPCRLVFEPGFGRPWYGSPDGPADSFDVPSVLASVLAALDPFDGADGD